MSNSTNIRLVDDHTSLKDQSLVVLVRARTRAREAYEEQYMPAAEEEALRTYWRKVIGNELPRSAHIDLIGYWMAQFEPELFLLVIDRTAAAPRPSWAYAKAILDRLLLSGIRTVEEWNEDNKRFRERRGKDV